jgi:hypothetical protein
MKKIFLYFSITLFGLGLGACESFDPTEGVPNGAVAVAQINSQRAFFNFQQLANATFEFTLRGEDFGRNVPVASIEVWIGLNNPARITLTTAMANCGVGVPTNGGGCLPGAPLAPLPSRIVTGDRLWRTVNQLPATITITAAEAAQACGTEVSRLQLNDTFLLKFAVNTADGRRFDAFHDGICDETRGQVGDCRLVARVRNP